MSWAVLIVGVIVTLGMHVKAEGRWGVLAALPFYLIGPGLIALAVAMNLMDRGCA